MLQHICREYPCDHVAMLNLAVLNVGSPRMQTHETAVHLLHLLDTRFFQEEPVFTCESSDDQNSARLPLNDIYLSVSYCHSQMYLSEQLAKLHPDLTMPMFSGIFMPLQRYSFSHFSQFVLVSHNGLCFLVVFYKYICL